MGQGGACVRQREKVALKHQQRSFPSMDKPCWAGACMFSVPKRMDEVSRFTRIKDHCYLFAGREGSGGAGGGRVGLLFQLMIVLTVGFLFVCFYFLLRS